jgi:hypothetical protein
MGSQRIKFKKRIYERYQIKRSNDDELRQRDLLYQSQKNSESNRLIQKFETSLEQEKMMKIIHTRC